jgi:hypothetical protein
LGRCVGAFGAVSCRLPRRIAAPFIVKFDLEQCSVLSGRPGGFVSRGASFVVAPEGQGCIVARRRTLRCCSLGKLRAASISVLSVRSVAQQFAGADAGDQSALRLAKQRRGTALSLGAQMPNLRTRKIIYTVLVIGCAAAWLPWIMLGFIVGIGALGLLSVLSLLRCIWVLPVDGRFSRGFYSAAIATGIIIMAGCVVFLAAGTERLTFGSWSLLLSGTLLLAVGLSVLLEMHAKHA